MIFNLFKRKGGSAANGGKKTTGGISATPVYLLGGADKSFVLAFGMRWRTLLRVSAKSGTTAMVKAAKGTHYIHLSHQLGYGVFPKSATQELFPAVLIAGKIDAGAAIYAMELPNKDYWLCMVRNGLPTAIDEWLQCDEAEVVQRVRDLLKTYADEQVAVYTNIQRTGISAAQEFSLEELFDVVRTESDKILVLPREAPTIPKPVMYACIVGAVVLGGKSFYDSHRNNERLRQLNLLKQQDEPPEVAWAPVFRQFLAENAEPSPAGFLAVRNSIANMPVLWNGWWLENISCAAGTVADKKRTWSCTGAYSRSRVGLVSLDMEKQVRERMPASAVAFPSLNSMNVVWTVAVDAADLNMDNMGKPESKVLQISSTLQPMLSLLSVQPDVRMTPVEMQAPKMKDGKVHPKPASIPEFYSASITLKGPMRSIDHIAGKMPYMDWNSIKVTYDNETDMNSKGINASAVTAEVSGRVLTKKGG